MKFSENRIYRFLGKEPHFFAIVYFLVFASAIESQSPRPFWDKWDSNIEIVLPNTQLEICLLKSTFSPVPASGLLECRPLEKENFPKEMSELVIVGDHLKEMKIAFMKTDRSNLYIQVRLDGRIYKFLSILFNKNLSSYFLELQDSENKYFIFLLDPAKISFPVE